MGGIGGIGSVGGVGVIRLTRKGRGMLADAGRDVVNTAWAFAKIGLEDASRSATSAPAVERHMGDLKQQLFSC